MKSLFLPFVWATSLTLAGANTAPTVVIQSAAMRAGTTLMDVVYRVSDPDDATVKTRALAFVDGVRSFANVIKPVTFVEGTATRLGDAIASNTNHTLTWDVGADWSVDLGQIKFEVLAMDGRGLLPLDWITIPAAAGKPAVTISKDAPSSAAALDAFLWLYASGDPGLTLSSGVLRTTAANGNLSQLDLVNGVTSGPYAAPFILKRMNLAPSEEVGYAVGARTGLLSIDGWHSENRPYDGVTMVVVWGTASFGFPIGIPDGVGALSGVIAIDAGMMHHLALRKDGTVVLWGPPHMIFDLPAGLTGVTAIAAGWEFSLALKSNGKVVSWGGFGGGASAALTGITAIAAGELHGLALKSDGTVAGWFERPAGPMDAGQATVPAGLSGVTAVSAGRSHSLALKSDGTVVGWGESSAGQATPPAGLTGVIAISAGALHSLALKSDGTVVGWGDNSYQQGTAPAGLGGVAAISAGHAHNLALKSDGTVVAWGNNEVGQCNIPPGLPRVSAISTGFTHSLAVTARAP